MTQEQVSLTPRPDRILSIDALKGFAALMIVIVHGVVFGVFTPDPIYFAELPQRVPLPFLILLAPIILMATWFPVFVFLAGVTIAYSFVRESFKENPDFNLVLKKKFVNVFALVILGAIYSPILSHAGYTGSGEFTYSVITGFIDTGEKVPLDVGRFFSHSVFAGIGMGMAVISIIFYAIFTKFTQFKNQSTLIRSMLFFEFLFIVIAFSLEYIVASTTLYQSIETYSPLLRDLVGRVYGGRHSMMPQLFFGFSGAVYGIIMANPSSKEEKHKSIRKYGWLLNLGIFSIFLLLMFITNLDYVSMIASEDLSTLFHLGNLAMMNWVVSFFFERFDFRRNHQDGVNASAFLRTFAPVTMTLYCMESLFASSLRQIFIFVFGANIFPWNGLAAVSYMLIIITFWYYTVKLWSKIHYQGSFEWGVVLFMKLFGTQSSRLKVTVVPSESEVDL